jgi:signal transduction histidine kinase
VALAGGTFASLFHDLAIGGLVANFRDITARKKAEEERERFITREWSACAQTEERRRISRESHDRMAHSIGVIHQSLELYEALKERNAEQAQPRMQSAGRCPTV